MYLYYIHTTDLCDENQEWYREFKKQYVCECKVKKPGAETKAFDVHLVEHPGRAALNATMFVNIARRDFLELFSSEVKESLNLGDVYLENGELLEAYVSYAGKNHLPIRGSKKSRFFRECLDCGSQVYLPEYPYYVLKRSLRDQILYAAKPLSGLIVAEELIERVDRKEWKGIDIIKIPVLDEPRDGLDHLEDERIR